MHTVFLALGSNVGDSQQHIATAIQLLNERLTNITQAPIYSSRAVGYTDQPDFYNTAIRGETDLEPEDLLLFVKAIEKQIGRIERFRWGPREIDIDIIFYDDKTLDTQTLTIPHPRFTERDFVLRPICDIDASHVDPVSKLAVRDLLEKLPPSELAIID
jgi:2-amino-4-hydroxy-6-hydroxymethyldihydropteridine diphosphokinase